MALNLDISPVARAVQGLMGEGTVADLAWQVALAAAALAFGWTVARLLCRRFGGSGRWRFGAGDFERVAFPLFAYAFLFVGARVFVRFHERTALLEIVASLLVAWIVIRLAVYVLGVVFHEGKGLQRTIRAIAWLAWIGVALHVTGLLPEVIEALDAVGFTLGKDKQRVTLWLIAQGVIALFLAITLAMWVSRVTENRVLAAEHVEMSTRLVVAKLVRLLSLMVAVLVVLPIVGIPITALSIFSGALGVGLGFGLQKIASNYVSGFIVLLDRSLRVGDVITVDNRRGEVKAIESRYTVIKGGDGVESIIPNEKLITESVNHHTYSDPKVSVVVNVSVSYDSDVERACAVLGEIAAAHGRVIEEPAAQARVTELGADGVGLALTVWIKDPQLGEGDLRSELLREVLRRFRDEGIDIPYPRRDVRLIATPATLENPAGTRG